MIADVQAFIAVHQAGIGLAVLGLMFLGFISERFPAAVVAILGACVFLLLGMLDAEGLFSVFSNPAPITIGALFIVSGALMRTGAIDAIAGAIVKRAARHPKLATAELFLGAFVASAFMNNTPVVLVLIPIMAKLAKTTGYSEKRLLMPLSFIAILGGTTTLIGTSTNLLVDAVARKEGMTPFGLFEITPYGLTAAAAGVAALLILGPILLPKGKPMGLYGASEAANFLTELIVRQDSDAIGRTVATITELKRSGAKAIAIKRGRRFIRSHVQNQALESGDHIILRIALAELLTFRESRLFDIGITGASDVDAKSEALVEATISPSHPSIGGRLADIPFLSALRVRILGVTRHNNRPGPDLPNMRIRAADRLLVTGSEDMIREMYENPNLFGVVETKVQPFRRNKAPIAIGALLMAVFFAALNIAPIAITAVIAVGIILATRCIDAEEAWSSIDGNVLVLIFTMLGVGLALENAGSVALVVETLTPYIANAPAWALVFVVYGVAMLLTEIITNNAVAILATPLVIALAHDLGVDPRPLIMAVMLAASACFATPIGYQTNTLVYAAGNYRFADFMKVGIPLNIIVGLASCVAISLFY